MNAATTLTVELEPERLRRLYEEAERAAIPPSDVLKLALDEWLARRARFSDAMQHSLDKNDEVLRRLA
ncbi:hypothetical protein [Alienimonas sp. DA493]|uniref:hypothetical protein n=1 Tax=Alienimonas sp. DA493 TaxID=3373605 RepID=UPI00375530C7